MSKFKAGDIVHHKLSKQALGIIMNIKNIDEYGIQWYEVSEKIEKGINIFLIKETSLILSFRRIGDL